MEPKISTLTIEGFRAFHQLKIEGLGRVNLITGRNNTGKSSVLEALRILASEGSLLVIGSILRFREEGAKGLDEPTRPLDSDGLFLLSNLFHGFPPFSPRIEPIVIESTGGGRPVRLSIETRWFSEERDANGGDKLAVQQDFLGDNETIPGLLVDVDGVRRNVPLDSWPRRYPPYSRRPFRVDLVNEPRVPCMFVSPYGGERTASLGPLWDQIALSDREKEVVEALRIIDPAISAVSMVGGEEAREIRTAIVRTARISRPVPLRTFGDGLNRLFGIVLSLVNAKGGLLLIDEFENGMHHTVQLDTWRAIFRLAKSLDVQVFATSHSWDAVESFQKAASETPEEGVLVRLSRRGEDIIPTLFREQELAVATRDRIEVR
jgi:hypothetical protein